MGEDLMKMFFLLSTLPFVLLFSFHSYSSDGSSNHRLISAAADYQLHCASCHGAMARGDGPVAAALISTPPDLTTLRKRNEGVYPRDRVAFIIDGRGDILAHGPREMPVWGQFFGHDDYGNPTPKAARERIEALTDYIEGLQR